MSDWLPSLNTLRAFEATARHLSFVKAAAELHVTPAAVKQLVRKLEETLGCPLIERAGRGLQLTVAGRAGLSEMTLGFDHLLEAVPSSLTTWKRWRRSAWPVQRHFKARVASA